MGQTGRQPTTARLLQATLALLGVSGVGGGFALLADPSGGLVDVPASLLAGTPFGSYLIPGLLLLAFVGLLPLVAGYGLAVERRFAWLASVVAGSVAIGWILVQVALLGYVSRFQPLVLGVGLVVLTLSLTGDVRAHYDAEAELDALVRR